MFDYSIIMAAGEGTRMKPLTDYVPKAMIKYKGKELIKYVIDEHRKISKNIFVTVGYKKEILIPFLIEQGISNFIDTTGHDNAWWIFNTIFSDIHKNIFVSTCDNPCSISTDIYNCSIKGVKVLTVNSTTIGDIYRSGNSSTRPAIVKDHSDDEKLLLSGYQIVNPGRICEVITPSESFNDVWNECSENNILFEFPEMISNWKAIDDFNMIKENK